jgi:hypothetical protein
MKKLFSILCTVVICFNLKAQQESNPGMKELEEKLIGWDKALPPVGNAIGKSTTIQGRTYTAYQIGLIDTFSNWIKKSYQPVGGLPEPERLALPDARESRPFVPKGTGVSMGMWGPCYDATGKKIIKSQPATVDRITILTNHIKGVEEASWFNTPTQYYFTMKIDPAGNLINAEDALKIAPRIQEVRSKIGDYFIYFTGGRINVMIMPGKKLPLLQVSRGEVLDKGEEALQRAYENKKISQPDTRSLNNIKRIREKYRNSLAEPAFINVDQLGIYSFGSEETDLFEKLISTRTMIPVYKINPEIYELCNKDKPQWISISWPYASEKSTTAQREIYKAMTQNFNFEYVLNYFFYPEKVKGKSYQPLH